MGMKVVPLYCSLSESDLTTHSDATSREIFLVTKISALWLDGTVSYVALDSLLHQYIELVMEVALLPLSMVLEMIQEWMVTMVPLVQGVDGTS